MFQNGCQISVLNGLYIGVCVADLHDPKIKQELGREPYIDIFLLLWRDLFETENLTAIHILQIIVEHLWSNPCCDFVLVVYVYQQWHLFFFFNNSNLPV